MRKIDFLVLHHSGTNATNGINDPDGKEIYEAIVKNHHERAIKEGWNEQYICDYHFVIGPTGVIFKGQPMEMVAYHCANYRVNLNSLGVCFLGNFEITKPTDAQIKAGIDKIVELINFFGVAIDHIKKHNDFVATDCPGKNFPFNMVIIEVKKMIQKNDEYQKEIKNAKITMQRLGLITDFTQKEVNIERLAVILNRLINKIKNT